MNKRDLALARRYEEMHARREQRKKVPPRQSPVKLWGFRRLPMYKNFSEENLLYAISPEQLGEIRFVLRPEQEWARPFLEKFVCVGENGSIDNVTSEGRMPLLHVDNNGLVSIKSGINDYRLSVPFEDELVRYLFSRLGEKPERFDNLSKKQQLDLVKEGFLEISYWENRGKYS